MNKRDTSLIAEAYAKIHEAIPISTWDPSKDPNTMARVAREKELADSDAGYTNPQRSVFLVLADEDHANYSVVGIFTTNAKAEAAMTKYDEENHVGYDSLRVEKVVLDQIVNLD